ncbi:MAG: hypothetical protein JKY37_01830 [Nannocystaceae bacterium]|nr:hypothetical protein [Nannocystaceae bacterium]
MESVAQRLRLAAFVSLLVIGCGPQLGEFSDGQWAIGVWYWDLGCEEYPCRGFGPGVDIATAEFRESGVVDISTVSLCTEYPDTSGTWEVGSGSSVRIEPVEHDFLRWVAGQVDWVEVTELD